LAKKDKLNIVPTSTLTNFKVLRKCSSEFDTKINEALLIKKLNPSLNKQLYGRGASMLLSVF